MTSEGGAERAGAGVACRLVIDGKVIEFTMAGPLVALTPASATAKKLHKKPSKRRGK